MLWLIDFPATCPRWFAFVAIVWSFLQGMAGFQYGLFIFDRAALAFVPEDKQKKNEVFDAKHASLREAPNAHSRVWAYGVHHATFYALCSLAGFCAWAVAAGLAHRITEWASVDGGSAAVLVASSGFAVAGISGALPRIMYLGGRPV